MKVADLGVGAGFYALEAGKLVGEEGRVFAVDVQKELVASVKLVAEREGLTNVESLWGDIEKEGGTKIKTGIIDEVIASNILFQVEDKDGFIKEILRILKPGGRALVIDWMDSFAGLGPHREEVVVEGQAESLFAGNGFTIEKKIDAGDHHYGFVARKTT